MGSLRFIGAAALELWLTVGAASAIADNSSSDYLELRRLIGREHFSEAIEQCRRLIRQYPDNVGLYETLPEVSQYAGVLPAAIKFFEERIEDGTGIKYAYYGLGTTYYYLKDYRLAVLAFKRAIDLGLSTPECYRNYEYAFEKLEGVEAAIKHFNSLSHREPDNANYAYALALAYWEKQEFRKVQLHSRQALARNPDEPRYLEANAVAMLYTGNTEKASALLERLLTEAKLKGDVSDIQLLRSYLVLIHVQQSRRGLVNATVQEILSDAREFGFFRWVGWGYKRLADVEFFAGNYEEALISAQKALGASERCKDEDLILAILVLQFHANTELGNLEGALDCCVQRLKRSQQKGEGRDYVYALSDIAWTYQKLGAHQTAMDFAIEALTRAETSNAQSLVVMNIHTTLGLIFQGLGNYHSALNHFKSALSSIPQDSFWARYQAISHASLGMVYLKKGDVKRAIYHLQKQLSIAAASGFSREKAYALADLGYFYLLRNQLTSATKYYEKGLAISKRLEQKPSMLVCMRGLASVAERSGSPREALRWHERAIEMGESMGIMQRCFLGERNVNLELEEDYRQVVRLLCNAKDFEEAFEAAELRRVRSGLDQVSISQRSIAELLSDSCRSRVLRIKSLLEGKRMSLAYDHNNLSTEAAVERKLNIQSEIVQLDLEYRGLLDSLQSHDSRFYNLLMPSIVSFSKLQTQLLVDSQAVLQFIVGEKQCEVLLVKRDTVLHFSIMKSSDDLRTSIMRMSPVLDEKLGTENLWNPLLSEFDVSKSVELYSLLIKPIEKELSGVTRLVVVPDGALKSLPFEVLVMDSAAQRSPTDFSKVHFMVERFELSYVPTLSYLDPQFRTSRRASKLVLAIGNPTVHLLDRDPLENPGAILGRSNESSDLPFLAGAEREVRKIKSLFGDQADLLTGDEATKERLKNIAANYRILHIAAHARFDDERPLYSCIYLSSNDGSEKETSLRAFELFNMDLNAEMVVLSACNTGRTRGTLGMEGLVRGFVFAGVRSIISSLWSVEDESTAQLMENFYRHIRNGERKSRALQLAKLELIRDGKSDPFLWAGFVLIGDDSRIDWAQTKASPGWSVSLLLWAGCGALLIVAIRALRHRV